MKTQHLRTENEDIIISAVLLLAEELENTQKRLRKIDEKLVPRRL